LRSLALLVGAPLRATLDILSARLVPRGAGFADPCGVASVTRAGLTRRSLYGHLPAHFSFDLTVPRGGRLDLALAALPGETVRYRAVVRDGGGEEREILSQEVADASAWVQRSGDLSGFAGRQVELVLEASGEGSASVGVWGAPIVSGASKAPVRPNVIFYVIDGGGADLMSVYGYNRRTTPHLERLAAEAVVFERAFSNSTWTQSSTASFMTSLQHSVLGGLRRGVHSTPVPSGATTMAERMRAGGYQTAVFTTNPNAARLIGLQRGVDLMSDTESEHHSTSSSELHEAFWRWREDSPGAPYWAHFQTTDVHEPNEPVAPFAGLYLDREETRWVHDAENRFWQVAFPLFGATSISGFWDAGLERAGIDRTRFFGARRALYDETMAYQDHQLGRFVEALEAAGEWDDAIFIVAADHGHPAGTFARFGRGLVEPQPEPWQGALFDSFATRVPLIVSWPGRIAGGRRITAPVSMIDVLPTILDLAGLPAAEVAQGRSLAPLLHGGTLEHRPVIFDEFRVDERTGEMVGNLEIVDGRWGASLEIGPAPGSAAGSPEPERGRHAVPAGGRWGAVHPFFAEVPRLLLYDLANDPFALKAVNEKHPELVERYRRLLAQQWQAHLALATRFTEAEEPALSAEQLQQLRALGYIQ
jgi:arylsulfatase A-like enzyme